MFGYNEDHILPPNMMIKSAGSDFYRNGLSLFSFRSQTRSKLNNPFLISTIISLSILKFLIQLFLPESDKNLFLLTSDWIYFLKVRYHLTISVIVFGFFALILQFYFVKQNTSTDFYKS
jgi:hypothetical protein